MNEKVLFITDLDTLVVQNCQLIEEQTFDFIDFYKKNIKSSQVFYHIKTKDPKEAFKRFRKKSNIIKAAGGLVKNEEGNYLFIYRNRKWDLPKGKLEKGEKVKKAAQREVEEECGVLIAENNEKLINTYHLYTIDKEVVLKKTTWFRMKVKGIPDLVPQVEEGITKAEWLNRQQMSKVLKNTYPLIKEVLEKEKLMF